MYEDFVEIGLIIYQYEEIIMVDKKPNQIYIPNKWNVINENANNEKSTMKIQQ